MGVGRALKDKNSLTNSDSAEFQTWAGSGAINMHALETGTLLEPCQNLATLLESSGISAGTLVEPCSTLCGTLLERRWMRNMAETLLGDCWQEPAGTC